MSRNLMKTLAGVAVAVATLTVALPANADCSADVANAFKKQRDGQSFRMKTRQVSARGLITMTVDYLLPYKMHHTVSSLGQPGATELILVGTQSWTSSGLGWIKMSDDETKALNAQFGKSVLSPPPDPLKYECLGKIDIDGRALTAYQGKQGESGNVRTNTAVLRTIYVDPDTGLPVRATVARATKPDLPFFKADYSYPKDIVIEPPEDVKPSRVDPKKKDAPKQSTAP